ncbi:MAG: ABC transporter substrate-binding protein [Candidatus Thorarchaeota archaeon]
MERKQILAIVVVAIIVIGIGTGVGIFLLLPGGPATNPYTYPGLEPEKKPLSSTIKFGLLDDMSWSGEGAWQGAYLAAKKINELGGVTIGGQTYWVGLVAEDTKEAAYDFDTATSAANTMVGHKPHVTFGGFRSEVFGVYHDIVMAAQLPFLITGTATEDWCKVRVGNFYNFYKYTFRLGPLNNKRMGVIIGNYVTSRLLGNITAHTGHPVSNITIVYENLMWTADVMGAFIQTVQATPIGAGITMTTEPIPAGGLAYDFDALYVRILSSGTNLVVPIISDPAVGGQFGARYNIYQPDCLVAGINVLAQFDIYLEAVWSDTFNLYGAMYEITSHGFSYTNSSADLLPFLEEYHALWGEAPIYTTMNAYNAINLIVEEFVAADDILTSDEIVTALEVYSNYTSAWEGVNQLVGFDQYHDILPQDGTRPLGWGENQFRQWQPLNGSNPYQRFYYSAPLIPGWHYGNETLGYFAGYTGPLSNVTYPTIGGKPLIAYKNNLIFPYWW